MTKATGPKLSMPSCEIIEVAPREHRIPTYKKIVYELGRTDLDVLDGVIERAAEALDGAGLGEDARYLHELLGFWAETGGSVTGMSLVFHEPGADDVDLPVDERRDRAQVFVGAPNSVLPELGRRLLEARESDRLRFRWFSEEPRDVYVGLTGNLRKRLKEHDASGRFGGHVRMLPLYETSIPERAQRVERGLVRWARRQPGLRIRNERSGGGGIEGGHGSYWVYVLFIDPA